MKHDTILSGLRAAGSGRTGALTVPTVLRFFETDFVGAFLGDLRRPDWRERLAARQVAAGSDGVMTVEQPVHRSYHLVVMDARCLAPGLPRLDPEKVVEAGLVLRRRAPQGVLGWMRMPEGVLGWQPLPSGALEAATHYDPDAKQRRKRLEGRNGAALARLDRLPGQGDLASEDVAPLFPIPPDLAKSLGMSLYYGFLPVISAETAPLPPASPPFSRNDVAARLPGLLRSGRSVTLPPSAQPITRAEMLRPEDHPDPARAAGLRTLRGALVWLAQECGAFGEDGAVKAALNAVRLPDTSGLFDWLAAANTAYLLQDPGSPAALQAPSSWPELTAQQAGVLTDAALDAMTARWGRAAPLTSRYPASTRQYDLRCFLRIEDDCGCPRIAWSLPGARFRIKPWYDGGDASPVQIELPALSMDALKALKPNVSFKVPPELQQHLDRIDLKNLMDGKHTKTTLSFGMICSFSIPIITICAFFILQIFLALLNIIFFWLPFVRICLPIPQVSTEEEG